MTRHQEYRYVMALACEMSGLNSAQLLKKRGYRSHTARGCLFWALRKLGWGYQEMADKTGFSYDRVYGAVMRTDEAARKDPKLKEMLKRMTR